MHKDLAVLLTEVNLPFFIPIGIGLLILIGLGIMVMKFGVRSAISSLLLGLIGAILGGLLFHWASLFPHAIHIGACVGVIILLMTKQAFMSDW